MEKRIEIIPYDLSWVKIFETEREAIQSALGENYLVIHHIGSTAVPGLAAKPKIDMIAEVKDLNFDHKTLQNLNYEYRGGFNLPFRKNFAYRSPTVDINLHVFEKNDPEIELNLVFRDYLRQNDKERDQYARLKYTLIEDETSHQLKGEMYRGYTLGKHNFIQSILQKTGFNRLRVVICTHYTEWDAAKACRNKYFFVPHGIDDPYTWTFNHKDHKHLILYQGVEIIGYAHIQLWPEARAAMRIIVIDEDKRNNNFGSQFLALCEKWLKSMNIKSLHAESRPTSLKFYEKNGYIAMSFDDPDGHESDPQDIPVGKIL